MGGLIPSGPFLLLFLQPLFEVLPSRQWLLNSELLDEVCKLTARFCRDFWRVRNPAVQVQLSGDLG